MRSRILTGRLKRTEGNCMTIDVDALRRDLKENSLGAFFGGGFGGALMEAMDADRASPEELVEIALRNGVDLSKYEV